MPYRGILNPSSSQYCTAARDDYCRKAGVQESTPEHEDAGLLVLALFTRARPPPKRWRRPWRTGFKAKDPSFFRMATRPIMHTLRTR